MKAIAQILLFFIPSLLIGQDSIVENLSLLK